MGRASLRSDGLKRGPWTPEEDVLLIKYIETHGVGRWRSVPQNAGLMRCAKSCRLRWMNYLRPDIKRGQISPDEEDLIRRLHNLLGNRWSLIAGRVPGRTGNEVKNYWNTYLSKKLYSNRIIAPPKGVCKTSTNEMVENANNKVRIEGDGKSYHGLPDNNNYTDVKDATRVGVSFPGAGIDYHNATDKLWIELEEEECIKMQQLYTASLDAENVRGDRFNYQEDCNNALVGPQSERPIACTAEHESIKASLDSERKAVGDVSPLNHNYDNCLEWSAFDSWETQDPYRYLQCGGDGYIGGGRIGPKPDDRDQLLSESEFGFPFPS